MAICWHAPASIARAAKIAQRRDTASARKSHFRGCWEPAGIYKTGDLIRPTTLPINDPFSIPSSAVMGFADVPR